ncbi:MAG: hypothetical protein WDM88_00935 [Galbitalea sp.]
MDRGPSCPTGIAVLVAAAVFVGAHLRYRRDHRALMADRDPGTRVAMSGGGLVALTAAATLAFALIAAVILVATVLQRR